VEPHAVRNVIGRPSFPEIVSQVNARCGSGFGRLGRAMAETAQPRGPTDWIPDPAILSSIRGAEPFSIKLPAPRR